MKFYSPFHFVNGTASSGERTRRDVEGSPDRPSPLMRKIVKRCAAAYGKGGYSIVIAYRRCSLTIIAKKWECLGRCAETYICFAEGIVARQISCPAGRWSSL